MKNKQIAKQFELLEKPVKHDRFDWQKPEDRSRWLTDVLDRVFKPVTPEPDTREVIS